MVIGPSGAGKSTLTTAFVAAHPQYELIRTQTTRPRRLGEADTHLFVDEATFAATDYLGTLDIFGARYGLPPFDSRLKPIVLLRVFALDQFRAIFPDARVLQVEAPVEQLVVRLRARGDTDRADVVSLQREIDLGRADADAVVDTSGTVGAGQAGFAAAILTPDSGRRNRRHG